MLTPRRRLRLARYKKNKRQRHQRFRQRIFERDRNAELQACRLPWVLVITGEGISTVTTADALHQQVCSSDPDASEPSGAVFPSRLPPTHGRPNEADNALVQLESLLGSRFLLITQNSDQFHECAGNVRVVHLQCDGSDNQNMPSSDDASHEQALPGGMVDEALEKAGIVLVIGVSGQKEWLNSVVRQLRSHGAHTVALNPLTPPEKDTFAETVYGSASEIVPLYISRLIAELSDQDD